MIQDLVVMVDLIYLQDLVVVKVVGQLMILLVRTYLFLLENQHLVILITVVVYLVLLKVLLIEQLKYSILKLG